MAYGKYEIIMAEWH